MKNDIYAIIIRPLITEKSTHLSEKRNDYAFAVAWGSNKAQIKQAIEKIYKVKVKSVRTANRKGKPRRQGRAMGTTNRWKKAIVHLHEEYRIDLF